MRTNNQPILGMRAGCNKCGASVVCILTTNGAFLCGVGIPRCIGILSRKGSTGCTKNGCQVFIEIGHAHAAVKKYNVVYLDTRALCYAAHFLVDFVIIFAYSWQHKIVRKPYKIIERPPVQVRHIKLIHCNKLYYFFTQKRPVCVSAVERVAIYRYFYPPIKIHATSIRLRFGSS